MFDYIDTLIQALCEEDQNFLNGDYFLQSARILKADSDLCAALSPEQMDLYLKLEDLRNIASELYSNALARQAFLLAQEIYR